MVRAKFKCESKSPSNEAGTQGTVQLRPVTSGSEENDRFFYLTPGGQVTLSTINESAYAQFEIGKEYYVDFSPAN